MSTAHNELEPDSIEVTVLGTPAAQGSKRHVGHGILIEQSKTVAPWRTAVAYAIRDQHPGVSFTGPVRVRIDFWLHKPTGQPKRRYTWPHRRPDLDKLIRSTLDGISESGAWHDDAQVVTLHAAKRYATNGQPLGARIYILTETSEGMS